MSNDWSEAIRERRRLEGWSQAQLADAMRAEGDRSSRSSLIRSIANWEGGHHQPSPDKQAMLAKVFKTATLTIFKQAPPAAIERVDPERAIAVIRQIQAGGTDTGALDTVEAAVNELCTDYSTIGPDRLIPQAEQWLLNVRDAMDGSLSFANHRRALEQTGWLSLLLATLSHDLGGVPTAHVYRKEVERIGNQLDHPLLRGWAMEIIGWINLSKGNYERALASSEAGLAIAGSHDVGVQLGAQRADCLAHLGRKAEAKGQLEVSAHLMDSLPVPDNPDHHFAIDADKLDKLQLNCATHWGEWDRVEVLASALDRRFTASDGTLTKPMRVAEAWAAYSVLAAEGGDLGEALLYADRVIDIPRRSGPSLLATLRPVGRALSRWSGDAGVVDFGRRRDELALAATG